MNKVLLSAVLLSAAGALTGCMSSGGKFACPAPNGVTCMSPTEIYEATNSRTHLEGQIAPRDRDALGNGAGQPVDATGDALSLGAPAAAQPRATLLSAGDSLALVPNSSPSAGYSTGLNGGTEALRVPARVMRIWVSPWTDDAGDLHMPGFIYTEVEGRRWAVGTPATASAQYLFDPNAD